MKKHQKCLLKNFNCAKGGAEIAKHKLGNLSACTIAVCNSHKLYSTKRKGHWRSKQIEQIIKPSFPLTVTKMMLFWNLPNEMQYMIHKLYSAGRKGT